MLSRLKTKIRYIIKRVLSVDDAYTPRPYEVKIKDRQSLKGKCGIITGATGAIGSSLALKFASEGAIVGVGGRSVEKIDETISFIKNIIPDAQLTPVLIDVTQDDIIESAITSFYEEYKQIDYFINNAGGGPRSRKKPLDQQSIEVIDQILSVNLRGAILCSRIINKYMIKAKKGVIINLSSVMGLNGQAEWTEYSAAKSGILGLTKSQALELGKYGIRVNSVSPGTVFQRKFDREVPLTYTTRNALQRCGYTDEVAALISFLISDEAQFITGQNITIDGGRSIGLK
ncbi:MAG: SDR family oxidoreductase [Duncaniella sp.]|uniref:SDR family NAD(P)-dependent oxidoreductase n=1 Tax=Duncaniella sp. TaxID=2518496 RepID=UPI0023C31AD2|nr:SDR family oxidoreductase [Duncaniella sp.]MDE6091249.1 SDR family oxidoreductase [Duncaniella sp.]